MKTTLRLLLPWAFVYLWIAVLGVMIHILDRSGWFA